MNRSKKNRYCPAVEREISSAECGENRVTRYSCPAECPFNPFGSGNYGMALDVEEPVNAKCREYLLRSCPDRAAKEQELERLLRRRDLSELHAWYGREYFVKRNAEGRTMAEQWEKEGFSGLKNDERVIVKARMQGGIRLGEIRRILDNEQVELVDLLSDGRVPFLVRDRSVAAAGVRFQALLGWCCPFPHYWRMMGAAITICDIGDFEPEEIVREVVGHHGGPLDEAGTRLWLAENFSLCTRTLEATGAARSAAMIESLDPIWGRVVYELRRPFAECRATLDQVPDVAPDELSEEERNAGFVDARIWFEAHEKLEAPFRPVLGRVLLGRTHWRLEAMTSARTARLRARFEAQMGSSVQFAGERLDDHSASLRAELPRFDQALVVPRLLEDTGSLSFSSGALVAPSHGMSPDDMRARFLEEDDRRFSDSPIPALNGKTPREAALDPRLRPKLIKLLKQRVRMHDERNLETGRNDDINWLLRELDVTEILFDPPPPRPPPRRYSHPGGFGEG